MLTIIIYLRNAEETFAQFYRRLAKVLGTLNAPIQLIFIDDASNDRSLDLLKDLGKKQRIEYLSLTKPVGYEAAIACALSYSRGKCAIALLSDLHHPPEQIPKLLAEWGENKIITAKPPNSRNPGIYLVDECAYRCLLTMPESRRQVSRCTELGFKSARIFFEHRGTRKRDIKRLGFLAESRLSSALFGLALTLAGIGFYLLINLKVKYVNLQFATFMLYAANTPLLMLVSSVGIGSIGWLNLKWERSQKPVCIIKEKSISEAYSSGKSPSKSSPTSSPESSPKLNSSSSNSSLSSSFLT